MPEKKIKLTRKEIRGPDEFQQTGFRTLDYANKHRKWLWGAIGVLVLASAGSVIVSRHRQERAEKGSWEISKLVKEMQSLESAPQAGAAEASPLWSGYAERASRLAADYKGTPVVAWARVLQGRCLLRAGKAAEAIPPLEEGLRRARYPVLVTLATELLGHAYLEKGDTEKARSTFKKLETLDSPLKSIVPYYLALVLETEGKAVEAKKAFEEAATESASTLFWGRKIRDDILMRELGTSDAWIKHIQGDTGGR
ncbi:MAG: hypothetical protein HYT87_11850 [Nitrospirae bacterium]|nr:hypothetical protein [Nitrospirota bacterium]